jgi:transposase
MPDTSSATLMPPIERNIIPDSLVHSDGWRGYDALDLFDFRHVRINHSKLFTDQRKHINCIENFWNQAKRHTRKYNRIPNAHFSLFPNESDGRYNKIGPSN